jgi:hypothetical protein
MPSRLTVVEKLLVVSRKANSIEGVKVFVAQRLVRIWVA